MVENDEQVPNGNDSSLDVSNWQVDDLGDLLPGCINVLAFIDVQLATVRAQRIPYIILKWNLYFRI